MILQSLVRYYETLAEKGKITGPGWCKEKVSYALELSNDGELKRVLPVKIEREKGKSKAGILIFPEPADIIVVSY